jgi:hypothetical protein
MNESPDSPQSPHSPYSQLARLGAELEKHAEEGHWETMRTIIDALQSRLDTQPLPPATTADRASIADTLAHIAAITERALPLRDDIARLLKALTPKSAAS